MRNKHFFRQGVKNVLDKIQTLVSTVLTWVSFVSLLPSLVFAGYYTFVVFDLSRVIAGLALAVVSVYVNKSL